MQINMDKKFFVSLPKLELHAHLNGSLSEKTLLGLQASQEEVTDFLKLNVLDLGPTRTLEECFEIFKIAHSVTSNPESVRTATENVIKEFSEDGVIYLELRTTPRNEDNMSKTQYIDAVIEGIKNCNSLDIRVKLILSLDRKQRIQEAQENVNLAIEYRQKHPEIIVGIDVSGDPTKGSWFESILNQIRNETDLKITVHCAEINNEIEIQEMLTFKPDRIGHGSYIHSETGGSVQLWEELKKQRIPVECCLTSNVKTKTITEYKEHHLKHLLEAGLPFTLCTDDKGVFSTSLSEEFKIAAETFGLSKINIWKICFNAIEYTFCSAKEKLELKEALTEWFNDNLYQETSV